MDDTIEDLPRQLSTLAFNILYQAITDALELTSPHQGGGRKSSAIQIANKITYEEARAFIFSDNLDAVCTLARTHYDCPTAGKVRDRVRSFLKSGQKMSMKELHRESYRIHGMRDWYVCVADRENTPSPTAQEKNPKEPKILKS